MYKKQGVEKKIELFCFDGRQALDMQLYISYKRIRKVEGMGKR